MHYMKSTRVMLPVIFGKFEMIYIFSATFFSLSFSIGKRSTLATIWGAAAPQPPCFYGLVNHSKF